MNILIKNADFSQVSIGKIDTTVELEKKCTLTNVYLSNVPDRLKYLTNKLKILAFDVSSYASKNVKVTGKATNVQKVFCEFFAGNCPTTDQTFRNDESVIDFESTLGSREAKVTVPDVTSVTTISTVIPASAKTLLVSIADESPSVCEVEVSFI